MKKEDIQKELTEIENRYLLWECGDPRFLEDKHRISYLKLLLSQYDSTGNIK